MAIYGIGANFGEDVSEDFISEGVACIGWTPEQAPVLHRMLKYIKMGDIIYIKSYPPQIGLIIKAVGIVTDDTVKDYAFGKGVEVRWIWTGDQRLGQLADKCTSLRTGTLFEETSAEVSTKLINLILNNL